MWSDHHGTGGGRSGCTDPCDLGLRPTSTLPLASYSVRPQMLGTHEYQRRAILVRDQLEQALFTLWGDDPGTVLLRLLVKQAIELSHEIESQPGPD